jgi:DNA primase
VARFSAESIERVKDAVDMVEVVSAYTELRGAGRRLKGLCPFHDERTPSFSVDATEKVYHCFGCGEGGDVFTFVQEKESLQFADAVELLADRYGVEVEREQEDPRVEEARKRRVRLMELLDRTTAFYVKYLWEADEARKAREYLLGRGLSEESLREFGVGFAPNKWDSVLISGQRAGYSVEELVASGLVKKTQKGSHMDHFRARIMFPIRDARGRMQGLGGRATRKEQRAKYVNSPEGELFRKSKLLYGIERARGAVAKKGRAVVVEGYTDVIAAHQAGVEETVAVMGTAITPDQVKLLAAHTEEVVLALDADRAGREAMLRAQRVASGKKVRLRVAAMPEGEDPADMLAGEGPGSSAAERFAGLVDGAVDLVAFHVSTLLNDADTSTPGGRDRALDEVVPVLASMGESITRDELMREVGERLGADPGLVARRLSGAGRARPSASEGRRRAPQESQPAGRAANGGASGGGEPPKARTLTRHELREQGLLAMCIAAPAYGRDFIEKLRPEHLSSPAMIRVRDWLASHLEHPQEGLPNDDVELVSAITGLVARSEREPANPGAMELSYLELELVGVERSIASAQAEEGGPPVELQRRRGELKEQISHHQTEAPKRR